MNTKQHKPLTAFTVAKIAFPQWKGRKAKFDTRGTAQMYGMAWDGGSRNQYVAVNLATGEIAPQPERMKTPTEMGGRDGDYSVKIPAGFAIVRHAFFCGRDVGCTVYLSAGATLESGEVLELAAAS